MRNAIILIFVGVLQTYAADVYSQKTRLSLDFSDTELIKVLDNIEKESEYFFLYNEKLLDTDRRVNISARDQLIDVILEKLFSGTNIQYTIADRKIILAPDFLAVEASQPQSAKVSGTVTDTQTGEPMAGVNIQVKGTSTGAISDASGMYSLTLPEGGTTLIFSFIGYVTQEVAIAGRTRVDIALAAEMTGLEEVVVIGYGTQKKVNLTGAVTAVKIDETISSRALSNVSSGLAGMVSGLSVTQNSGMAGNDNATLIIRGLGSPNNTNPLIVVDGMPDVDINKLNINDIESVSVLKDAASSAIYGSRAANGVILVTTKRGQSGKIQINYTGSYALRNLTNYYKSMDDYPRTLEYHNMALMNAGKARRFMDGTIEQWMAMENIDPVLFPNTDWWDVIYKTGMIKNNSLSATGGNDRMNFYTSIGQMSDNGVSINTNYNRKNFRTNLDYKILKNLKIGTNIDGTWSNQVYGIADGINNLGSSGSREDIYKMVPGVTVMDDQGRFGGHMAYMENNLSRNQYATIISAHTMLEEQELVGKIYGEWAPIEGLSMHIDYSLDYLNIFKKSYSDPFVRWNFQTNSPLDVITTNGSISNNYNNSYKTLFQGVLSYTRNIFEGHKITAMGVYSEEYWFGRYINAGRQDRIHPDISEINGALNDKPSASGSSSGEGLRSLIGRINYSVNEKYLLEANLRADASSKFLPGYQWGIFPSFSAGWRFSEEGFFESIKNVIPVAKLRASWGMLGNNSGVGKYEQQDSYALTNYSFGQKLNLGASSSKLINYDFTWEKTNVTNIGLDFTLYKKLTAEIDFYDRLTSNIIRGSELSSLLSSNYDSPNTNIGELQNRGVELNLTWKSNIKAVDYGLVFNYSFNRNKLLSWNQRLGYGVPFLNYPYSFTYTFLSSGIAQNWTEINDAPYQGNDYFAPGDILYKDVNGDGQITNDDRVALKNSPRSFFNSQISVNMFASWKNFNVSTVIQASAGSKDFWIDWFKRVYPNDSRYQYNTIHTDNWNLDNRNSTLTRLVIGTGGNNERESTFWLYKRDFLRMKNIQLGYSLPARLLEKVKVTNMRVYFSGENIFTITKWPGVDPEKAGGSQLTSNPYPLTRSLAFGVNVTL